MSAKLDKIGADLKRARAKWHDWEARTKELEQKYAEQENQEICEITHSYNLNPDQLAVLLELAKTMPPESAPAQAAVSEVMGETAENDEDENEEDNEDEAFED